MPYKLRLEFPGAIYHIINRGNYRRWIFEESGAKAACETCLFEACKRCEWLLHAFVIMSNHFHLALETPRGNLVTGMQWLESTYANRFNRFRDERGHLFQSRYKALLVEPGDALGQLCTYIDLNPVRAGIVSVERLRDHRYSSYWYLDRPQQRPKELDSTAALSAIGGLSNTHAGNSPSTRANTLEVIMRRYETRSTIMTSNRPLEDWGKMLQDVPTTEAILDRFLHHAQIIAITGKSYRLKDTPLAKSKSSALTAKPENNRTTYERTALRLRLRTTIRWE